MTQFVDLKTDRSLIKVNFEGYKLSLESIPVIKIDLNENQYPYIRKATSNQYLFLHAELFSMQNLLVQDPWNRESSYFVGNNGSSIYCSHYKENTGRPSPLKIVYEFGEKQVSTETGYYNFSFKFVSEKYSILCDGYNSLYLFDTGDRYKLCDWKLVFRNEIVKEVLAFVIKDARLDIFEEKKIINVVLQHIKDDNNMHCNELYCGSIFESNVDNEIKWNWQIKNILFGKGLIYYCAFEPKSQSIIICSNKAFVFKSDENEEATSNEIQEKEVLKPQDENSVENISYSWTQTEDDIVIYFKKMEWIDKNEYKVICTDETITVKCSEQIILDNQKLYEKIDSELTTWSVENNALQITLMKKDCNVWNFFVKDGPAETTSDTTENAEAENKPIPNLETPIEDCDMPITSDEEYFINRINFESKKVTHQVDLGNYPPLFSTVLRAGFPAAIATRTDVDASLWLQQYNPSKPTEWKLRHEGNLHAFGYVQASKLQKKFIDCAPDLGYSVISESHRHVFIYNSKYETANNLRNRNGPKISLGKQNVVTLEHTGEILGMSCGINFTTLLSEKCLLYIQINKLSS